ncbi:MAG: hypothetical protein QXU43_06315 [Thermoproteota archaeon]
MTVVKGVFIRPKFKTEMRKKMEESKIIITKSCLANFSFFSSRNIFLAFNTLGKQVFITHVNFLEVI